MAKRTRNPKQPAIPAGKPEQARAKAASIEAQAQAARQARASACAAEIQAVLQKHNCALGHAVMFASGQAQPEFQLRITALDAPGAAPEA